ncbi:MAG: hypothetical protein H7Z37_15855 [Pyrinomonadaceae bacterium]|nr:hypothetical protein [Pyrinomonadaceae bacterium]
MKKFVVSLICLFAIVLMLHGKPVPFGNEYDYLLRLMQAANPNFLENDWTFSTPANEHWLFNNTFGFLAKFLQIQTLAWICRVVSWLLLLIALLKIGELWNIKPWQIVAAITVWLGFWQSLVGDEWIFGGFEAKVVAYICLLFALREFSTRKIIAPSILLGLSFSFHPAIGLLSGFAIGAALLFDTFQRKISRFDFAKFVVLTIIFGLIGALPLISEQIVVDANANDNWRYLVLTRMPWHFDPFAFNKSNVILLFAMFAFNVAALWRTRDFAMRFLLNFQIVLSVVFVVGVALRFFEMFELLKFMPFRAFPVFTPLFALFTMFRAYKFEKSKLVRLQVTSFAVLMILATNSIGIFASQIAQNYELWTNPRSDFEIVETWISQNTPPDSLVIQTPNRREIWYLSQRAQIANYTYPTYDNVSEWRTRIADLSGNLNIQKPENASGELETAYENLSDAQIEVIKRKYGATHLVSKAFYNYPVLYESGEYKIYQLK